MTFDMVKENDNTTATSIISSIIRNVIGLTKHFTAPEVDVIGLMGRGNLYQHLQRYLASRYGLIVLDPESSSQDLPVCKLVVWCNDTWSPAALQKINQRCLQTGVALLPIYTQFNAGIIGPCVMPAEKGCASCADFRKIGAAPSDAERELLHWYFHGHGELDLAQPWLSSFAMSTLATLVAEEIAAFLQGSDQLRTRCALLSVSLETLDCRRHPFLPLSYCPDCGKLAADTAEDAAITLQSRQKPDAFTYRTKHPTANPQQLITTYTDERTGLVYALVPVNSDLMPIALSHLHSELPDDVQTAEGTGCTLRPEQSKVVSLLESVERYAGLRPRSKYTTVHASYHQLVQQKQAALDPTTLGLHSPEQYEYYRRHHSCRHLVAYDHDLSYSWVWGYSCQRRSPILVPEHCAYYGVPISQDNPAFVYEISNGCALGSCLEEAIFHGIMEVVERDAFLLSWYAQLGLPRLDLDSVSDPTMRLLTEHIKHHSGYSVYVLNATLDHAIPCLLVLGIDEQKRDELPRVHVMAGSHPHPEQALLRALREFTASLVFSPETYRQRRAHAQEMLAAPELVREMEDHALVYYLPAAFERLAFLLGSQQRQTFQEAFDGFYRRPPAGMDLRDDLERLMNAYLARNQDIIVVDQTAPEHLPCGLRCVKILMPGLLPMTFGQQNRRIGLVRLSQLPHTLGYRDHPLTEAEINPYPHPFF
jgi:ribosomal protein S12 methylthiotransferase accessory factor